MSLRFKSQELKLYSRAMCKINRGCHAFQVNKIPLVRNINNLKSEKFMFQMFLNALQNGKSQTRISNPSLMLHRPQLYKRQY